MKVEAAEFVLSAHGSGDYLRDGRPEVAFVGRSNVGKSSLLNRLLGRKGLARTSSTPGRTQAVNYFLINRRFYFVDLPGYGYAKAGKEDRREWAARVEGYFREALRAACACLKIALPARSGLPFGSERVKVENVECVRSARGGGILRDGRPEVASWDARTSASRACSTVCWEKGLGRTSSTPGRTQAVNYFLVNRRFDFVDLPGYGYAKAGKEERREWAARVEGYFREAPPALLVLLVDGNVGATKLDEQAYEYLSGLQAEILVAATKVDRFSRGRWPLVTRDIRKALNLSSEIPVLPVSARSGDGIKELWGAIAPRLEASTR